MQIGGLGSSHGTGDHHVTTCIHDHREAQEDTGAMAMKTSASMEASGGKADPQPEGQFSLSAWLKNVLGNSRGFLLNFWGNGQTASGSIEGSRGAVSGAGDTYAAVSPAGVRAGTPDPAAAALSVIQQHLKEDTCLRSASAAAEHHKQTLWQRVKMRFNNVQGQVNGRRSHKFSGFQAKDSFPAGQEKAEEELRRNNRHRKDTVEINCARTEDSYLMDSYDCRGEYSRLTTIK